MQVVAELIEDLQVGAPQTFESLTMFPLSGAPDERTDYVVLDVALEKGWAKVAETTRHAKSGFFAIRYPQISLLVILERFPTKYDQFDPVILGRG